MSFAVGSLVRARGREWVVLPASEPDLLVVRPLGGSEDEVAGLLLAHESVEPAQFDLPDPARSGDFRTARLLRDAVRLGFRSSAGPFRSFAQIAVEPHPYQLVPLMMALRQDVTRLLVADDVGIGKTIEACLIARELLDRGEIRHIAVLSLPQVAEQWQAELREKFHIDAELVLPSTAARLERNCRVGQSLFDLHPFVVVSTDYIKSDRRLTEFKRTCPEFVIVDEAHACAMAGEGNTGRHQRHRLVHELSKDPGRHLVLVTATPHSGSESAFHSLLGLLDPTFQSLPDDLSGPGQEAVRRKLATHMVQRRRGDIRRYLAADTPFPMREEAEETYKLTPAYKELFAKALRFAQEVVRDESGGRHRQRVRWWSALALLRSIGSSPAAAAQTLRNRASGQDAATAAEVDKAGQRAVLDLADDESAEDVDVVAGANIQDVSADASVQRRLEAMAEEADLLRGDQDAKLKKGIAIVQKLLKDGYAPIVFCRFIPTAEYVADALRAKLPKSVEVVAVTGTLAPAERSERINQLSQAERRVLVCTDCLSEGINLQESFNAVLHYDLCWNPTRHEQREGRVDRFGQPSSSVRVLTYYGEDNQIDGIMLDVLLRKHKTIKNSLGVSVPVPIDSERVMETIFEGLLLRGKASSASPGQLSFALDDLFLSQQQELHTRWEDATAKEKRSRTLFAQESIHTDDVAQEMEAVRHAIGCGTDVEAFWRSAIEALGGTISGTDTIRADLSEVPVGLRDAMAETLKGSKILTARFRLPVEKGQVYLSRTHPCVEAVAAHVMDTALDPLMRSVASRCGAIRTKAVQRRSTVLLVRGRFHIVSGQGADEKTLLAEDLITLAFESAPEQAQWLSPERAEELIRSEPDANIPADQAADFVRRVVDGMDALIPQIHAAVEERGQHLFDAHKRVRVSAHVARAGLRVDPQLPADILGVYVFLPA